MARSISDEEFQLRKRARRRLIGAIVLVTAVVVVLPMVLDTEPKPVDENINIKIPSPDSGAFKPEPAPSSPTLPSTPESTATVSKPAPSGVAESNPPAASTSATRPAESASTKKSGAVPHAPGETAPAAAKPEAEKFAIQVVALADASKARHMQRQISNAGVKVYTEVVKTAKGDVTRVRAGPFATRQAAEKARERLKGIGFDGKVIPVK